MHMQELVMRVKAGKAETSDILFLSIDNVAISLEGYIVVVKR